MHREIGRLISGTCNCETSGHYIWTRVITADTLFLKSFSTVTKNGQYIGDIKIKYLLDTLAVKVGVYFGLESDMCHVKSHLHYRCT